jgi:dimeric dUTPase (all-alpha-NTP-PPase superfamily)
MGAPSEKIESAFMIDKLAAMLELQNTMNLKVHPQWQEQKFRWTRAIMVEGVEALDHIGWKWWKKQEPDLAQARIELVDIWHFILSHAVEHAGSLEAAHQRLAGALQVGAPAYLIEGDIRKNLEILIASAAVGEVHMEAFIALLQQTELTRTELYNLYVAKNVLNMFRQNHGYKTGSYVKVWNGLEDNQVLADIIKAAPDLAPADLNRVLEATYSAFLQTVAA